MVDNMSEHFSPSAKKLMNDDIQITGHYDYYSFASIGSSKLNGFFNFNKMNRYKTKIIKNK